MIGSGPFVQVKIILKETVDRYFTTGPRPSCRPISGKLGDRHPGLILVANSLAVFASIYWASRSSTARAGWPPSSSR